MSNDGYSFVKTADLKDYMSGIGLDADQAEAMQDVLDGLQRELERYCQRRFELKERTERVVPDEGGRLWLKATPIVSVSAPVGLSFVGGGNGLAGWYPTVSAFTGELEAVQVTYVGGLDPEGDDLHDVRIAILRAAAREATLRHDDTVSVTDLQQRNVQPADRRDPGFTDDELKKFDRLRRRTVAS